MNRTIVVLGLALVGLMLLPCPVSGEERIDFYRDLGSAHDDNSAKNAYILYFGATWCDPCKRMKSVTFEVLKETEEAKEYQWLKYDIDESPEIATRYGVMSVPAIVVLDKNQNPVGASAGFMTADQLLAFVEDSLVNPQKLPPTIAKLEEILKDATDATEQAENIQLVLAELTNRKRPDRGNILKLLAAQPVETQRVILKSLELEPLGLRAAATEALAAYSGKPIDFDPFESAKNRERQLKKLKRTMVFDQ